MRRIASTIVLASMTISLVDACSAACKRLTDSAGRICYTVERDGGTVEVCAEKTPESDAGR